MKIAAGRAASKSISPEQQLQSFIGKFDSANQVFIRAVRQALRKRLPSANELVYDNYNFFVIGYSPTERPSDSLLSLVADRKGVRIAFPYIGARMKDPHKLLRGSGNVNRALPLSSAKDLARPQVEALLVEGIGLLKTPFSAAKGKLIIRSVSAKQRPRK